MVVTATDDFGNEATCDVILCETIDLELDDGDDNDDGEDDGTVLWWNKSPGSAPHDVIRGSLSQIAESGSTIDLGAVTCIENDSPDGNTVGQEDVELPASGEVFFYLVGYDDGVITNYGSTSDGRPRAPGPGDCG